MSAAVNERRLVTSSDAPSLTILLAAAMPKDHRATQDTEHVVRAP
jgi:hypothetical protein